MDKKYVEVYDWVRVIAIILVVIGHGSYLSISTILGGVNYELPSTLNGHYNDFFCTTIRNIGSWAYQFHMPIFFLLSGAVAAISNLEKFDTMFEKKIKRLLVPYYVYGLLFMLPIKYCMGFYGTDNIKKVARSFLGISECGHLWFLPVLFWCFVFSYLLFKTVGKKSIYLVFVIVFILWRCTPDIENGYYGLTMTIDYLPWFVIGYIFEKNRQKHKTDLSIQSILMRIGILSVIVWAMSGALIKPDDFISVLVKSYWVYCIAYLGSSLFGKGGKIEKTIKIISRNSIYIYIFHDPLEYVVLKAAFKYDWLSSGYGVYFYFFSRIVLVFMISLVAGILITQMKDRIKGKKLLES